VLASVGLEATWPGSVVVAEEWELVRWDHFVWVPERGRWERWERITL